jgi:5-formyltetrahydrofolate cyclo-ligase
MRLPALIDSKALLREAVRRQQTAVTEEEQRRRSATLWTKAERSARFAAANTVLLYWSMRNEVFTHDFIRRWHRRKSVLLPVIDGDSLRAVLFEGEASLRRNETLHLYEPTGESYTGLQIDLAFIPGMAFDCNGHRLGRGKGYYDRFLPQLHSYNVGVCFASQLFDSIPSDELDVSMNEVWSC